MGKRQDSVRMFGSDLLERLSHVHPVAPLLLWAPLVVWLVWRSFAVHGRGGGSVGLLGATGCASRSSARLPACG